MIADESLEGTADVAIVGETSTNSETNGGILVETSDETRSKSAQNVDETCESFVQSGENLNATVLDAKDLVYTVSPSTGSDTTILSLSQNVALNPHDGPIVSTISENNVNFDTQTVLTTSENGLLAGFISASQKDEISVENISSDMTNITGHCVVGESEDLGHQGLGDLPPWAARLKGCERIGDSYRGYVHTEAELDILLSMHKEHTNSAWGTRQSPSSQKPSVRFMWKSQYVPYDGIPFLNSGRRATVMECQYGPRRKGNKMKVEYNEAGQTVKRVHRPTCPARIYIKRVRKFPEYKIDGSYEGTPGLRLAQERALTQLRVACLDSKGEERYYVQFPLEIAHEYHHDDDDILPHQTLSLLPTQVNLGSSRLDPRVVEKINELVARGVTDIYQVKHGVINFVEKDLFLGSDEEVPARHNKLFFPTITDLQNHIHQAQLALEAGTLQSLPPPETPPKPLSKDERSRKRKRSEPRRVRASKSASLRTICIRTDDPLELARDPSLQETQGQVYVMVPSASGLFTNPESLIGASLDGDKTTSLVQVLTVPASTSSAFLGQQVDKTLDLTGQFLALPLINCDNHDPMETTLNKNDEKEPNAHTTIEDHTQTASLSTDTITILTSPSSIQTVTPISPAAITIATPIPPKTNTDVNTNQNITLVTSTIGMNSITSEVVMSSHLNVKSMTGAGPSNVSGLTMSLPIVSVASEGLTMPSPVSGVPSVTSLEFLSMPEDTIPSNTASKAPHHQTSVVNITQTCANTATVGEPTSRQSTSNTQLHPEGSIVDVI